MGSSRGNLSESRFPIKVFMSKLFVFLLIIGVGSGISYYFLPKDAWDNFPAVALMALKGRSEEIRNTIAEDFKDPQEKRQELITGLKTNMEEIKSRLEGGGQVVGSVSSGYHSSQNAQNSSTTDNLKEVPTQKLIEDSDNLITQLQASNNDLTIGQKITDKIMNAILPISENSTGTECVKN